MRRLVEEYGTVLLYIITGIICIVLFSMAFFGENSSISNVINSSIDNTGKQDIAVKYKITYNLGNDEKFKDTDEVKYEYTKADQIVLPQPTKDGYLFAGWTGTRLTKPTINVIIPEGSTGDREYTPTWTKGYYRIEFDNNLETMIKKYEGLTEEITENGTTRTVKRCDEDIVKEWMTGDTGSMVLEYEKKASLPNSGFVFKGHRFVGWGKEKDCTNKKDCLFVPNTPIDQEKLIDNTGKNQWAITTTKLYAQWEEVIYNIEYKYKTIDYVYSLQSVDSVKNENPVTYKITDSISLSPAKAEGYKGGTWYVLDPYAEYLSVMPDKDKADNLNKDGKYDIASMEELIRNWTASEDSKLHNQTVTRINPKVWSSKAEDPEKTSLGSEPHDLVLYPLWEAQKYIITYNANLPDFTDNTDVKAVNEDGKEIATITIATENNDNAKVGDITIVKNGDGYLGNKITTKAVFASKYKNFYEYQFSKDENADIIVKTRDKKIPLLTLKLNVVAKDENDKPKDDNVYKYKFTGWALDTECKKRVNSETTVSTASDHTLYACWDPVTYKIKLHSNY